MTAPLLLETLRSRGARLSVADRNGAPVLLVSPRGIASDLAGDVARFKPSLVELLEREAQDSEAKETVVPTKRCHWRERDRDYWEWVASTVSPGAASICAVLQDFTALFEAARRGALPSGSCRVLIDGEALVLEEMGALLVEMQTQWGALAESFNRSGGDLSQSQREALDRARQLLTWLHAAQGSSGEWLDLEHLVTDEHAKAKKRAAQVAQNRTAQARQEAK